MRFHLALVSLSLFSQRSAVRKFFLWCLHPAAAGGEACGGKETEGCRAGLWNAEVAPVESEALVAGAINAICGKISAGGANGNEIELPAVKIFWKRSSSSTMEILPARVVILLASLIFQPLSLE